MNWIARNCSSVQKLYRKKVVYEARYIFIAYKFNLSILIIPKQLFQLLGKLFYNEGNKVKSTLIENWFWSFFDVFFSINIIVYQTIPISNAALFYDYVTSSIVAIMRKLMWKNKFRCIWFGGNFISTLFQIFKIVSFPFWNGSKT